MSGDKAYKYTSYGQIDGGDRLDTWIEWSMTVSLIILFIIVSVTDIRHRIIPNWATLGFGIVFVGLRIAMPSDPWWDAYLAMVITYVGLALVSIWSRGALGGGDVKLLAIVALLLGTSQIMNAIVLSCTAAIIYAIWRRIAQKKPVNEELPFGPFIAIGVLITWSTILLT